MGSHDSAAHAKSDINHIAIIDDFGIFALVVSSGSVLILLLLSAKVSFVFEPVADLSNVSTEWDGQDRGLRLCPCSYWQCYGYVREFAVMLSAGTD